MASLYGPGPTPSQLVLLLLGEKKSGKSGVGNAILGTQAFHKETTRSCKKKGVVFGLKVTVVDTPGWLSQSTTPDRVSRELCRGVTLCDPGPDVIMLVLPTTTTFGQVEWKAMESHLRLLQTPIWQRALVVFTYRDKLGNLTIQKHIKQQDGTLQWLLERCRNRYHIMTNQSSAPQAGIRELFEKFRKMASGWPYTPQSSVGWKPALSLILLGRRKSGKSSAGNTILGREEFQTDEKTIRCSTGHAKVSCWPVTVVDTPGWSLFGLANPEQVRQEMIRSPSLCPVGSKVVFLLAVPVGSFREKDRRAVEKYVGTLGNNVWKSTLVLFTYGDMLRRRTIDNYIKKKGEALQWVLDRCGHRHHVCDTNTCDKTQVKQLLEMVEKL